MIGTNDPGASISVSTSYSNILAWISAIRSAGAAGTFIICTNISEIGQDTFLQALGVLIRGGASANGYLVADVQSDANMGQPGDFANTTYFHVDGIHPTQFGQQTIAPYIFGQFRAAGFV